MDFCVVIMAFDALRNSKNYTCVFVIGCVAWCRSLSHSACSMIWHSFDGIGWTLNTLTHFVAICVVQYNVVARDERKTIFYGIHFWVDHKSTQCVELQAHIARAYFIKREREQPFNNQKNGAKREYHLLCSCPKTKLKTILNIYAIFRSIRCAYWSGAIAEATMTQNNKLFASNWKFLYFRIWFLFTEEHFPFER